MSRSIRPTADLQRALADREANTVRPPAPDSDALADNLREHAAILRAQATRLLDEACDLELAAELAAKQAERGRHG